MHSLLLLLRGESLRVSLWHATKLRLHGGLDGGRCHCRCRCELGSHSLREVLTGHKGVILGCIHSAWMIGLRWGHLGSDMWSCGRKRAWRSSAHPLRAMLIEILHNRGLRYICRGALLKVLVLSGVGELRCSIYWSLVPRERDLVRRL
jgi:hypothetical protein